jgi:hypothetical protein
VSKLNPSETLITSTENIPWKVPDAAPPESGAEAVLAGGEEQDGAYLVLMKWYPGWMSAPHTYVTDRLCVVISGVWWCNSGPDFDPPKPSRSIPGGSCAGWPGRRITTARGRTPLSPRSSRSAGSGRSGRPGWTGRSQCCGGCEQRLGQVSRPESSDPGGR